MNHQTQPTIKVIDAMMGSGKTTYMIKQLNNDNDRSKRFLIVTPYLKEIDRLIGAMPDLCFQSTESHKSKSKEIKDLIAERHNVVIIH